MSRVRASPPELLVAPLTRSDSGAAACVPIERHATTRALAAGHCAARRVVPADDDEHRDEHPSGGHEQGEARQASQAAADHDHDGVDDDHYDGSEHDHHDRADHDHDGAEHDHHHDDA